MLLDSFQLNAPQLGKRINLKVASTGDLYLLGEPTHLSRLFSNLIGFTTPEGGTVEIQSSSEGYYVNVKIQASALRRNTCAERFWRADQSRSWAGGSGLGLAIAQAISKPWRLLSPVKVGSCFTVCLPDCARL